MTETKKEMVTSLRVDPDLWKEAKVHAIMHDMSLAEVIEEALKQWIQDHGRNEK